MLLDRRDDDLRGPHGLPAHQDGLREASLRVVWPKALELRPVAWQQPEALPASLQVVSRAQVPDGRQAA